jgi:acetyltransferase-like isoleucine patch superfamily enzyme
VIKEKVLIGSNVLTGMGSVVVRDIPNNEIWVGNPAKFLRFNDENRLR